MATKRGTSVVLCGCVCVCVCVWVCKRHAWGQQVSTWIFSAKYNTSDASPVTSSRRLHSARRSGRSPSGIKALEKNTPQDHSIAYTGWLYYTASIYNSLKNPGNSQVVVVHAGSTSGVKTYEKDSNAQCHWNTRKRRKHKKHHVSWMSGTCSCIL